MVLFSLSFLLPNDNSIISKLQFVKDNFHGQLPQHFRSVNGTFESPLQPFNDLNKEEISRYIEYDNCHYIVFRDGVDYDNRAIRPLKQFIDLNKNNYIIVESTEVIDSVASTSSVARSYFIPYYSFRKNKYVKYQLLKKL